MQQIGLVPENNNEQPISMQGIQIRRARSDDARIVARHLEQACEQVARCSSSFLSYRNDPEAARHRYEEIRNCLEKEDEAYFVGGLGDGESTVVLQCSLIESVPRVYNPGRSVLVLRGFHGEGDLVSAMGSQVLDEAVRWAKEQSKTGMLLAVSITWEHEYERKAALREYTKTSALRMDPLYSELFSIEGQPALIKPAGSWYFQHSNELLLAALQGRTPDGAIRRANERDIEAMVQLSKSKRHDYARFQPVFWRPAEDGESSQADFFLSLLQQPQHSLFVSEGDGGALTGFIIGLAKGWLPMIESALYMNNGLHVDDFVVMNDALWPSEGRALLAKAIEAHQEYCGKSGVVNVISGAHDTEKRRFLAEVCGMRHVYNWDVFPAPGEDPS